MINTVSLLTVGALLGVIMFLGILIVLHDRFGLPVPVVDIAIIIYVTLLAASIVIPAYFGD